MERNEIRNQQVKYFGAKPVRVYVLSKHLAIFVESLLPVTSYKTMAFVALLLHRTLKT